MPKILSIDHVALAALRRILLMPLEKMDRAAAATADLHYAIFLLSSTLLLGFRNAHIFSIDCCLDGGVREPILFVFCILDCEL